MSYNPPYQNYQPAAYPPPPPPRQSSVSSYTPALPPRPPPTPGTPGTPNVQDLTSGFAHLSTDGQSPSQQTYVPHAEYHQAVSTYTWPTDHGASLSSASQAKWDTPPPLPPRPSTHSPWQSSWQAPQSPPPPSYAPQQSRHQVPAPQSSWAASHGQPSPQTPSSHSTHHGAYNRPPPPPPAELQPECRPPYQYGWAPQGHAHPTSPTKVSPIDSSGQTTSALALAQFSHPQQQYHQLPRQQTYCSPSQQGNVSELPAEGSPPAHDSRLQLAQHQPHPPTTQQAGLSHFVFEMEGSTPGVPDQKQPSEDKGSEESNEDPVVRKLQRTFTDTLRQAGPYFYAPPTPAIAKEETAVESQDTAKQDPAASATTGANQDAGSRPESGSRPVAHDNEAQAYEPAHQTIGEQLLRGAVSSCYYMKIPNPAAEVRSDQADRYFVPYRCEYPEVNDYADAFYFHHKDVSDFWLCGFCFETRIRHTEFASSFEGGIKPKDNKLKCSFGAPRMLESLWPHALQTKDLKLVKEYMEKRMRIKDCYGAPGVLGQNAQGVRWLGMRNNDVPGFLACEACYEEMLIGTTLQDKFAFYPHAQGPEDKWSCDLALEYLRRGLVRSLKTSDWNAFVSMASRRTSIPACAGSQGVAANSRKWYKPANPIEGVVTCEACHLDYFGFTQFDQHFIDCPVPDDSASNQWSCDLAPIPVKNAIEAAKKNSNFAPIHATLTSLATIPVCANGAVSSNTWYNLTDGTPNFDVCPTCYTGLFACIGLSHLFRPSTTSQPTTRICDLSQHSPRFKEYIINYLSLINTPDGLPTFLSHIARYAPIPKCARRDPVRNQRWHLLNGLAADLVVCDECHADFTSVTPLAGLLVAWPPSSSSSSSSSNNNNNNNNNNTTTTDPVPRVCDMYSATMRARWTGLCATYDPSNPSTTASLDAFVAFSRHRHRVYEETMPHCRELLQAARLRGEQQRLANTMATHYHSMGLMTGGTGYGLHGGYGGLYAGQAAAAGAQGVGLMMETGADMGRVAVLEKRWEEVE